MAPIEPRSAQGSTLVQDREQRILREWSAGTLRWGEGEAKLVKTRQDVVDGWRGVSDRLKADGDFELGERVDAFLAQMPPAKTEKQALMSDCVHRYERDKRAVAARSLKEPRMANTPTPTRQIGLSPRINPFHLVTLEPRFMHREKHLSALIQKFLVGSKMSAIEIFGVSPSLKP